MITSIITANIILIAVVSGVLLLYVRRKINFLVKHVSNTASEISEFIWTARTVDAHVEKSIRLPRPNPWTLDGAAIATLCEVIHENQPSFVVELGSGLSTPIIGAAIREYGGKLLSIDHDPSFAAVTRSYITANGLQDRVEIRVAELKKVDSGSHALWYDKSLLADIDGIDFLLIDGPPKAVHPMIRQHALPFFFDKLSPAATLLLDDTNRSGEAKIIDRWRTDYPVRSVKVRGFPKSHTVVEIQKARST